MLLQLLRLRQNWLRLIMELCFLGNLAMFGPYYANVRILAVAPWKLSFFILIFCSFPLP